jgi:hypothetical protein
VQSEQRAPPHTSVQVVHVALHPHVRLSLSLVSSCLLPPATLIRFPSMAGGLLPFGSMFIEMFVRLLLPVFWSLTATQVLSVLVLLALPILLRKWCAFTCVFGVLCSSCVVGVVWCGVAWCGGVGCGGVWCGCVVVVCPLQVFGFLALIYVNLVLVCTSLSIMIVYVRLVDVLFDP